MADIWEADADRFAFWLVQRRSLPEKERADTIGSIHNYFSQTHESITIPRVNPAWQTKRSEANTMKDRQLIIDEIIKEWKTLGVFPQSYGEAYSQGVKKGKENARKEAIEEAIEEGIRQTTYELAQRMIQDGAPDSDVRKYTLLSLEEIEKLRNGGGNG